MDNQVLPSPILLGDVTLSGSRTQASAGALVGYVVVIINGTEYCIPYYALA